MEELVVANEDDLSFFVPETLDRIMGMLMELAAQLNQERYRRIALEELLVRRSVIETGEIEDLGNNDQLIAKAQEQLQLAIERLFAPVVEHGHPWRPLRRSAAGDDRRTTSGQESRITVIDEEEEE